MDDAQSPPDSGNGKGDRARRASLRLSDAESVAATRRDMFGDGSLLDSLAGSLTASEQLEVPDEPAPVALPGEGDGGAPVLPQSADPAHGMAFDDLAQPLDTIIDSFPADDAASEPAPSDGDSTAGPDLEPPGYPLLGERAPVSSIFSGLGEMPSGEVEPPEPGTTPSAQGLPAHVAPADRGRQGEPKADERAGWPPPFPQPPDDADGAPAQSQAVVQPPLIVPPDAQADAQDAQPGVRYPQAREVSPPAGAVLHFPTPPAWPPFPPAPGAPDTLPSYTEGSVVPPFIELPADGGLQPEPAELADARAASAAVRLPAYPQLPGWPPPLPSPVGAADESGQRAEPIQPPFIEPMDANETPPYPDSSTPAPFSAQGAGAPPFRATGAWPPFPQAPGADDGAASEPAGLPPFIELPADDAASAPEYPGSVADDAAPSFAEPRAAPPVSFPELAGHFSDPTTPEPARALDAGGPRASLQAATRVSDAATAKIAAEVTATAEALENLQRLLTPDMPEPHMPAEVQPQPGHPLGPGAPRSRLAPDPAPFGTATDISPYLPLPVESPDDGRRNVYLLGFVTGLGLALAAGAALFFLINTG